MRKQILFFLILILLITPIYANTLNIYNSSFSLVSDSKVVENGIQIGRVFGEITESTDEFDEKTIKKTIEIDYIDKTNDLKETDIVIAIVYFDKTNESLATKMSDYEMSKMMYDYKESNFQLLENIDSRIKDNITLFKIKNIDLEKNQSGSLLLKSYISNTGVKENYIGIQDSGVEEKYFNLKQLESAIAKGVIAKNEITKDTTQINVYIARYDIGKNIFSREDISSTVDKKAIQKNTKYAGDIFGNRFVSEENMFNLENIESSKFNINVTFNTEQSTETIEEPNVLVPEGITGNEGELDNSLVTIEIIPSIELEENTNSNFENILINSSFDSDIGSNKTFDTNKLISYKLLDINYTRKEETQIFKPYSYNMLRTFVITDLNVTKDKILSIGLYPSTTTKEIYVAIDAPQSKTIPVMTSFVKSSSKITVTKENLTQYIKIDRNSISKQGDKLNLELKANVANFSLQIIEVDSNFIVTGVYSSNILQLTNEQFVKYNIFQTNRNIIEFYCPSCDIKDYGINENGFSNCGKSIFEEKKKLIVEYIMDKSNVCLVPDGKSIGGFTNKALETFGMNRLFFEWDESKIYSGIFDYGEYYIDQDQFRIASSKKLDYIKSREFTELGGIKLRLGKNKLIARTFTSLDFDINSQANKITNTTIDDSLAQTKEILLALPEPLTKLTVVDLYNWQPKVTDKDFDKYFSVVYLPNEYYKSTDYHTHYQFTIESYLNNQQNQLAYFSDANNQKDSQLRYLYNQSQVISGFTNIFYAEGLDYYIYNFKPFGALDAETNNILTNKYTPFLSNNWTLNLDNYNSVIQIFDPKTYVIRLEIADADKKDANYSIEEITDSLFLGSIDYYSNNSYFAYNNLFKETINPVSYNYNNELFISKSNSVKSGIEITEKIEDYSDIQDGYILNINSKGVETSNKYPLVITEDYLNTLNVSVVQDGHYNNYTKTLISQEQEQLNGGIGGKQQTTIIYPYSKPNLKMAPILLKSNSPLLFNWVDVDFDKNETEYIYKINGTDNQKQNISSIIADISLGNKCFVFKDDEFLVWNNIDSFIEGNKNQIYADSPINQMQVTTQNKLFQETVFSNTSVQPTTQFAIYIVPNENQNNAVAQESAQIYLNNVIIDKKLETLKNNYLVYSKLNKSVPEFNKYFEFDNYNICNVVKTIDNKNLFKPTFKLSCVSQTPTIVTKDFWLNPKVNFCSAFVRNFAIFQFGYNFDSANAWNLSVQKNNISLWSSDKGLLEENWNYLIPGAILGIKHLNTSYVDKKYSHVVIYLGKIGNAHYIAHSWGTRFKIEKLDAFLKTVARGRNDYGLYEDGEIREIMISKDLYAQIKNKAKEEGISLGKFEMESVEELPSYTFDSFNTQFASISAQKTAIDKQMYKDLESTYNEILAKQFDIYYKKNYANENSIEYDNQIILDNNKAMIIILAKYKRLFLVKKTQGKIQIIGQHLISTGVNGFGCENDSSKTPIGLFKIIAKQGKDCEKLQIIGQNGCETENGKPVFATLNSGVAKVVTRKLFLDGLEKGNIGVGCEIGNRNTVYRGIYIHGTNYEKFMGQQKSLGCIRMLNNDVITLFNSVPNGTYVYISNKSSGLGKLLEIEESLITDDIEYSLVAARKPIIKSSIPKKTMTDVDNYINNLISNFRMLNDNTSVSLNYAYKCNIIDPKFPCFLKSALDVEYEAHVVKPQSSEFNYIVFRVTKAFNYSLEETAQFWGSIAQESGTSTNITGSQSQYGNALIGKPAYGIAQIEKAPWKQYEANKYTFDEMVNDFRDADLSSIIEKDSKIGDVTKLTGNLKTIDSRKEIIALLDLVWTNQSKYASVVFSAGLKRYIGRRLIDNSQENYIAGRIREPFWGSHKNVYDHSDSINFNFAVIYKYKYTGTLVMYSGIKLYSSELDGGIGTIKTITLKLANYFAFKKEYYMYYYGLKTKEQSSLISTLSNAHGGKLPK
ncbi:MAG: L,D-transpeptidase [archaeon]|jgi:hypothetical protein